MLFINLWRLFLDLYESLQIFIKLGGSGAMTVWINSVLSLSPAVRVFALIAIFAFSLALIIFMFKVVNHIKDLINIRLAKRIRKDKYINSIF